MTNLSTSESNNSNGEVLGSSVVAHESMSNEESHIATALLGHFREYYGLGFNKEIELLQKEYNGAQ